MLKLTEGVEKFILDNGLTVLIKENHSSPVVAIYTYVKAGYFNESDDVAGISHLIEHMFFKGTVKRGAGQIALETKELGGYLNASTIYDHTLYYTVLPSWHFAQGLELQSDALINSVFDPGELKNEIDVVIQEAKRKLDIPSAVAQEKLYELAYKKHRMRRWRIGTEPGLRKLTRDDFITFHKNLYRPENIILVVVGDIESQQAKQKIKKYYTEFAKGQLLKTESPPEPEQMNFRYKHLKGSIQQNHLMIGFHSPGVFNPDTPALDVLSFILGSGRSSRLYQGVKEKKSLVYTISAYNYSFQDLGIFLIEATASDEKIRHAEIAIFHEIKNIIENGVMEEELIKARNMLESAYTFSMESVSGQASLLASHEALGDYHLVEKYLEDLYRVQADDVVRVAQKYLVLKNCSLFEYAPENASVEAIRKSDIESKLKNVCVEMNDPATSIRGEKTVSAVKLPTKMSSKDTAITRYRLSNGAKVLVKESHQIPIISTGVFSNGGRYHETGLNAGISGLMTRSALKGTSKRTAAEIAGEIENLGTSIHFSNEPDYLNCTMNVLSRHFEAAWDIFAEVITDPVFPQAELDKEKENTIARISRLKDDMFSYPLQLYYANIFNGHAYGLPSLGTPDTIAAITREDLITWHQDHLQPDKLLFVAVGDVETERYLEFAENLLTKLKHQSQYFKNGQQVQSYTQQAPIIENQNKQQTALIMGFPAPNILHEDYYPLKVLQNVLSGLGGRFFEELRGRQSLAYTVSTYLTSRLFGGTFFSYIATSPEKEEVARQGLLTEFKKLIDKGVTADELNRSIKYTSGTFQIGLETHRAQMEQYAHYELLGKGIEEVPLFPQKIENVTTEAVLEVCQKYFDTRKMAEAVLRSTVTK